MWSEAGRTRRRLLVSESSVPRKDLKTGWLCSMEVVCDLPYDRLCETGSRVSFWTKYSTPEQNSPFSAIRDGLVFISGVESSSNPIIRGF